MPGLISAGPGQYLCPRCGAALREPHPDPTAESLCATATTPAADQADGPSGPATAVEGLPPAYDSWELDQQLRHVERVLRIDRGSPSARSPASTQKRFRVDAAHADPAGWHQPEVRQAKATRRRAASRSAGLWLPALTWLVLGLGLMASAFGGVLMVWAAASERQELWGLGMPVGLGGQMLLVIGLVLQLDRLWHDNRHTAEKLNHVDERLHDLDRTTTLLGTSYGSPSSPFYTHMAGGASPQLLLADLKSQLDLLAVKLGQEER